MARTGRKPKPGKRINGGRHSRAGVPSVIFDKGTDKARDKFSVYGQDGSDAIGRAYIAGLLGDNASIVRDYARKVFRAYWPMLAVGPIGCAIGDKTWGSNDNDGRDYLIDRERWLTDTLRRIDRMGRPTRKAFDQLVIEINPDEGPAWLESLIWHKRHDRSPPREVSEPMDLALAALVELAT